MKGLDINVNLSDEQIEQISNLTADKVKYTSDYVKTNERFLKNEIDDLKRQVSNRDKMIVEREITIDRYKKYAQTWKERFEEEKKKNQGKPIKPDASDLRSGY